jgi:hypothetical protein
MSFFKSKGFKYLKNLIIGVGAAVVLVGALFKIQSWPFASEMLTIGLFTEAGLFLMLGLLGPDKDYYWEKLYPGLADYDSKIAPITDAPSNSSSPAFNMTSPLDGAKLEGHLATLVAEFKGASANNNAVAANTADMAKSLISLKALQEADFSQVSEQTKKMGDFYANLNAAMASISDSVDDAKRFKEQLSSLNNNLGSLNNVYGNILTAMASAKK